MSPQEVRLEIATGNTRRYFAICFSFTVALWEVAVPLLAGPISPGYNHWRQYLSELGEQDAPHGQLVSLVGFLPIGLLVLGFLWAGLPFLRS